MLYIETGSTDAAYNFACEVFCMKRFGGVSPVMLIWQADNWAMLGRYQVAPAELNAGVLERIGAKVVRRNTGGGTIYTDLGNLLYTFILPLKNLAETDFSRVCLPIVTALREMGIPAQLQGRNDIVIHNQKISGNAQTIEGNLLCSHGSLLYQADLDILQELLIVDPAKVASKGITSVRSRVTNIIEHIPQPYSVREFWQRLTERLFAGKTVTFYTFTAEDIAAIEQIRAEKFAAWNWNFGQTPNFNYRYERRFSAGKVAVSLAIHRGIITHCKINGDLLGFVPIEPLEEMLTGLPYRYEAIAGKLAAVNLDLYFRGISSQELLTCMFA
jgi:lipoate-protein ligase A